MKHPYTTTDHQFLRHPNGRLGVYNSWDCHATALLVPTLHRQLQESGQWEMYTQLVRPLLPAVVEMQQRGVLVDGAALDQVRAANRAGLDEVDRELYGVMRSRGFPFDRKTLNSDLQLGRFLFSDEGGGLGLRPAKRTEKTGRPSVDQDSLTRVLRDLRKRDEPWRDTLCNLFHRSRLHTVGSRYLKLPIEDDGRVRAVVKVTGTKTQRFAYEHPAMQQYPPECRRVFVAPPGSVLVSADYSQLEARLLAYQSGAAQLVRVFEEGGDIHALNAQDLFGLTPDEWSALPNRKAYRNLAKTFFYRKVYGGTIASGDKKLFCPCHRCADKVPSTLNLSPSEAREAEQRWSARNPEVDRWYNDNARWVREHHYLPLLLGGRRYLSKPWGPDLARELANLPMQTGAAQVMNRAQIALAAQGVPIILQVHDQFVVECPEARTDEAVRRLRKVMERPVTIQGREVVLPVDVSVGYNWGDQSEDNPKGLQAWPTTRR